MSAIPKKELVKKRVKQTYEGYPAVTSVWQDPELEAMPDAPVAAPDGRSIDELMVAATSQATPGSRPIVDPVAPAREAFYGYIPDAPMRSKADEYETAAKLGLAKNIMAMGGLNGGTDPEAYVKARLAERARYEDLLNTHNMNKEAMDPTSVTSQGQQAYLANLGVDVSGLGAKSIADVGAPQFGSASVLKDKDIAANLEKTRLDNEAKIAAARIKKGGGGGGGGVARIASGAFNADRSINWDSPEAKDALSKTGNNKVTAERYLRDPKQAGKIDLATLKTGNQDNDQLRAHAQKYGAALQDYADLDRVAKGMEDIIKRNQSDLPGKGLSAVYDPAVAYVRQTIGAGTQRDKDTQNLKALQTEAKQIYQKLKTGMGVSIPEGIENSFILAMDPNATETQVIEAVARLRQFVNEGQQFAQATFGPAAVRRYRANKAAAEGKIIVRSKIDGSTQEFPITEADTLRSAPDFDKEYEIFEAE